MRISDWSSDVCSSDLTRVWQDASGNGVIACKGAPEAVLPLCGMAERDVARVLAGVQRLAAEGLRVLAVAGGETSIARLPDDPGRLSLNSEGLVAFEIGRASCRARVCQYV